MKFVVLILLVILVVCLEMTRRSWFNVLLIVFFSSISAIIFRDDGILISLSAILILIVYPIRLLRKSSGYSEKYNARPNIADGIGGGPTWALKGRQGMGSTRFAGSNSKTFFGLSLLVLVSLGLATGIFNIGSRFSINSLQLFPELASVTFFPIVVGIFIKISRRTFESESRGIVVLRAFVASIYLQFFAILISVLGFQSLMPDFLVGSVDAVDEAANGLGFVERFGGLIGDYELIVDYSIMVIAFSIILLARNNRRITYATSIVLCLFVGSYSGTRSFFVVLLVAFLLMFLLLLIYLRNVTRKFAVVVSGMLVVTVVIIFANYFWNDFVVFERLSLAWDLYQKGSGIEAATNRNISATLIQVFEQISIFGEGAFLFTDLSGNEIVSHNVLIAAYCRYGLLGLLMLLALVSSAIFQLLRALRAAASDRVRFEIITLLAFTVALVIQEMKISALRSSAGILIYTIWFAYLFARVNNIKFTSMQKKAMHSIKNRGGVHIYGSRYKAAK